MINRRTFLVTSSAALTFPLVGCPGDTTLDILNTVIASAEAILAVADPNAPWLPDFEKAIAAVEAAETSWNNGSAVTIVISALNTLAAVTAAIPEAAAYSPLVDILVAGIDAVLATLPVGAAGSNLSARPNPHQGRVVLNKPHFLQTRVGAYKSQWNAKVAINPAIQKAHLN